MLDPGPLFQSFVCVPVNSSVRGTLGQRLKGGRCPSSCERARPEREPLRPPALKHPGLSWSAQKGGGRLSAPGAFLSSRRRRGTLEYFNIKGSTDGRGGGLGTGVRSRCKRDPRKEICGPIVRDTLRARTDPMKPRNQTTLSLDRVPLTGGGGWPFEKGRRGVSGLKLGFTRL